MKKCGFFVTSSLVIVAIFSIFYSSSVLADNSIVDIINITVPVSCSLSGTNLLHTDNIQNGQYKNNIGSANIKATCNDTGGFAIYAIGYTNEEDGNNKMHSSALGSTYDIVTGKYVSGTTTNSVWSMKLTPVSGTYAPTIRNDASYNYTNFEVIPSEYTKVAYNNSATDVGTGSTGSNFTTTYAVYASTTQPAGTYTGKVKFTLVHPQNEAPAQPIACEGGKICYNANTSTVTGQMGKQTPTNAQLTNGIPLWAPNFKRDGYGFAGWNTAYDYSGTTYGPQQTITTPADLSTNGLSLYAVWVPSAGVLQGWTGCSNLASGTVTALTDTRDNDTYAVAKLADGKCWIIENLRLDDTPELSASNTHDPSLPIINVYDETNPTTSNHLSETIDPDDIPWCTFNTATCITHSMMNTNNTTLFTNNTASSYSPTSNVYGYGNHYNWYSATAGHGKHGNNYGSSFTAPGDICPAGWHLPTGKNTSGDFGVLDIALGGTGAESTPSTTGATMSLAYRSYPNNFVYSGGLNGAPITGRNYYGIYWSASGNESDYAYNAYLEDTDVYPGTYGFSFKYVGYSVRCIAGT